MTLVEEVLAQLLCHIGHVTKKHLLYSWTKIRQTKLTVKFTKKGLQNNFIIKFFVLGHCYTRNVIKWFLRSHGLLL